MMLWRKMLPLLLTVQHLIYQKKRFHSTGDFHKLISLFWIIISLCFATLISIQMKALPFFVISITENHVEIKSCINVA